jgi:DNA polymerase III sliding clamp (beta) subunit (PCNA family)
MKIQTATLKEFLKCAKPMLGKKNAPGVTISTNRNFVEFAIRSMDLKREFDLHFSVAAEGENTFTCTLSDSQKFLDYVAQTNTVDLSLSSDEYPKLVCKSGNVETNFVLMPGYEFQALGTIPATHCATIESKTVKRIFAACAHALSRDDSRYNLGGFNLSKTTDKPDLVCVATDGHRLAALPFSPAPGYTTEGIISTEEGFWVPGAVGAALARLGETCKLVSFRADAKMCHVGSDYWAISWVNSDVQFPNWRQVVPKTAKRVCSFDRSELIVALKAFGLTPKQDLIVEIERSAGKTTIKNEGGETIVTLENVDAANDCYLAINARYLRNALENHADNTVTLASADTFFDPLAFKGGSGLLTLIMPIRTQRTIDEIERRKGVAA